MGDMEKYITTFRKDFIQFIPHLIGGLVTFVLMWIAAAIVKSIILHIGRKTKRNPYLFDIFANSAKTLLFIMGIIMGLGTLGINVTALITSLGLAGFALGLALKDPLSNMIAGVMLLYYHPFRVGDMINIDSKYEGKVANISLRYTEIVSEGNDTLVPNTTVLNATLTVKD